MHPHDVFSQFSLTEMPSSCAAYQRKQERYRSYGTSELCNISALLHEGDVMHTVRQYPCENLDKIAEVPEIDFTKSTP